MLRNHSLLSVDLRWQALCHCKAVHNSCGCDAVVPEGGSFSLYSVGDCKILEHSSAVLSRGEDKAEALNITDRLLTVNSQQVGQHHRLTLSAHIQYRLRVSRHCRQTGDGGQVSQHYGQTLPARI